jgi:hypothetical protein
MKNQQTINLITPIIPERLGDLFTYLKELKGDLINTHMQIAFDSIGTIHFARWVVIDYEKQPVGANLANAPKLIFAASYDGDSTEKIRELCTKAAFVIDKIYCTCIEYPPEVERNTENRITYLKKWIIPTAALYRGSPHRTLPQVRQENDLRNYIRQYLDETKLDTTSAKIIHQKIQQHVFTNPAFSWAKDSITLPKINWLGMIGFGLLLLLLSPIIILWILILQFFLERKDTHFTLKRSQLNEAQMLKLEEYEDLEMQNQFSQLVVMKPGKMRLITFKAMMLVARILIKFIFVKGKLMGIPSIHYAKWVLFDNNKRVLFFSNFDGSWMQYLGDFIDKSGWGLTGIFSNTTDFPKTKFLIMGGAYDEEHFLAWSRNSEIQTQLWYSAYPHLSIKNVNNNSLIRQMLSRNLSGKKAQQFLNLI